jgi:hypothetical protein
MQFDLIFLPSHESTSSRYDTIVLVELIITVMMEGEMIRHCTLYLILSIIGIDDCNMKNQNSKAIIMDFNRVL